MKHIIIRHQKENRKKCTLTPLEHDNRFTFIKYPFHTSLPKLDSYIVLTVNAPLLTQEDRGYPLVLIDGTWRYAEKMLAQLPTGSLYRSLPKEWKTAYPRRQEVDEGLASIEALFAAFTILGLNTDQLLDKYYWAKPFLEKNRTLILDCRGANE